MRNYKKYLAVALAATMVVGSSVVAQAAAPGKEISGSNAIITDPDQAQGTIGGNGTMEGNVDEDVFRVIVPASMTGDEAFNGFDFVLDPQMLITKTDAAKYITDSDALEDLFVKNQTLYFYNRADGKLDSTSEALTVVNKSSIKVDVTLDAEITGADDIVLSETETFEDDATSMYMALVTEEGAQKKAITKDGANVSKTIGEAPEDAYDTIINEDGEYEYALVDDDAEFETYDFALTGASNKDGDWANLPDGNDPTITITWSIKPTPAPAAPSIATTAYTYAEGSDVVITVDLGAGEKKATGIDSISFVNANNATRTLTADTDYTLVGNTLTIKDTKLSTVTGSGNFTITFNDTAKTAVAVTISGLQS